MKDSDLDVVDDNDVADDFEDQEFDNFDDAADTLEDDDSLEDGQPEDDLEDTENGDDQDDDAEPDAEDNVLVKLDSGDEVPLSELKSGYLKDKDYRHKTTELADERKQLVEVQQSFTERSKFVETTLTNLTTYLENLVPPEPPISLAQSDPGSYQYQKALRENAISELAQLVQMQDGLGQAQQGFSQEDITRLKGDEDAKLLKAMPHLSDPTKRAAFDTAIKETAIEFGFTEDEVAGAADHRILQLVHYARLGKRAVTNRNNAKRRVEAPKKGRARPAQVSSKSSGNRKAKERLSKSGSIDDAMGIDFD
ncbi:hypothetical protein [Tateyamaria sp.]|uniref:hypothetical protein n=1 Tax=Tateyamaria sp. TaxID=1929288 RepID=UPI003B212FA2